MTRPPSEGSSKKRSSPRELARFIEELSWLLKSFDGLDYNALGNVSQSIEMIFASNRQMSSKSIRDQKSIVLVGVLPSFLMDMDLFPSNEGIVEFAEAALGLAIPRWQKKSRYEIVGHIVCNANEASPTRMQILSDLIEEMRDKKTIIRKRIEQNRLQGESWSDVIGKLYSGI